METKSLSVLLKDQLVLLTAARASFQSSLERAEKVLARLKVASGEEATPEATVEEKETLEAMTSRFSRLSDLIFQRVFRTIDQIELIDEGTNIDRLNRMEKRGIVSSAEAWRSLRALRNDIVHEYLIDASDYVVKEALKVGPELISSVDRLIDYVNLKQY